MHTALRKIEEVFTCVTCIGRTLDLMQICEEEIASAERRARGTAKKRIHNVFGQAQPNELIRYGDPLYRHHVRELIDRARRDEKFDLATDAEIMVALCEGSLLAPLDQQHAALYEHLFAKAFGVVEGEPLREPYKGATDELLHTLRKKFARAERKAA